VILVENLDFFSYPSAFDDSLVGSRRNFAVIFRTIKLEWWSYKKVKLFQDRFSRFHTIHERDGATAASQRYATGRAYAWRRASIKSLLINAAGEALVAALLAGHNLPFFRH